MNAHQSLPPQAPFADHLGMRLEQVQDGKATLTVELRPELLNRQGAGHGGVLAGLLESAMSHAALSRAGDRRDTVTVDMGLTFMRPAQGRLMAQGRVVGGGKSVCFCEADLHDASGQLLAKATGTLRYCDLA